MLLYNNKQQTERQFSLTFLDGYYRVRLGSVPNGSILDKILYGFKSHTFLSQNTWIDCTYT